MSTKTSIKRIALVAVSALGFGLLSVVPAKAAQNSADINGISLATVTSTPVINAAVAVNFLATSDNITNAATDADFVYRFTGYLSSYPAGGAVTGSFNVSAPTTDTEIFTAGAAQGGNNPTVTEGGGGSSTYTVTLDSTADTEDYTGNSAAVATSAIGAAQFSFTPTVAGNYVLTVFNDADNDGNVDVTEAVQTISISVLASAPTTEAAEAEVASITAGTFPIGRPGVAMALPLTVTESATDAYDASEYITLKSVLVSRPSGSSATAPSVDAFAATVSGATDTNAVNLAFTPDVAGTYVYNVWHDTNRDGLLDQGTELVIRQISILVDRGAVASITVESVISSTVNITRANANAGALVKITAKDAAGLATPLSATEFFSVTDSSTDAVFSDVTLSPGDFTNGVMYVNATSTAAASETVTFTVTGAGTLSNTIKSTLDISFTLPTADATDMTIADVADVAGVADISTGGTATDTFQVNPSKTSITFRLVGTVGDVLAYKVTDTNGVLTGKANLTFGGTVKVVESGAVDYGSVTISGALADSKAYAFLAEAGGTDLVYTPTGQNPAFNSTNTVITPDTVRAQTGSSLTFTVTAADQYENPLAGQAVAWSVTAGRNATTSVTNKITDANGESTYTVTDAPATAAAALLTTDTVRATIGGDNNDASVTYAATVGVNTIVAATSSADAAGVGATTINQADVDGTTNAVTITLRDAAQGLLTGVPVTVTTSDAGAGVVKSTVYTAAGVATFQAYSSTVGTKTFTATADGKTTTFKVKFSNGATDGRVITLASAASSINAGSATKLTISLVDAYGNPVDSGTNITLTTTGPGRFSDGLLLKSMETDDTGSVSIDYISNVGESGTATIKAAISALTHTQCDDLAGKVGTTTNALATAAGDCDATLSVVVNASTAKTNDEIYAATQAALDEAKKATAAAEKAATDAVAAAKAAQDAAVAEAKAAGDAAVAAAKKAGEDAVASAKTAQDAAVAAAKAAGDAAVAAAVKAALDAVAASKAAQDAAVAQASEAYDASLEAIDAANAATDAANLAQESADAATVAAEEARDAADAATAAVEELATQMSTLFASLKAQITTLGNTVAKIAKKVKA